MRHLLLATVTAVLISGCAVAPKDTPQETELRETLESSKFQSATRQMRDGIETQDLFAQAAFWSHEYQLNPADLEAAIKLSAAVRRMGNPGRAVEITQTTRAMYPRDPYLAAEFGAALIAAERGAEALKPIDTALSTAPGYARLWSLRGAALDQMQRYDQARAAYQRALKITPYDPSILANLGLSYALEGNAAEGETWLMRAASIPGASESVHQNLAIVQQLNGKPAKPVRAASRPAPRSMPSRNQQLAGSPSARTQTAPPQLRPQAGAPTGPGRTMQTFDPSQASSATEAARLAMRARPGQPPTRQVVPATPVAKPSGDILERMARNVGPKRATPTQGFAPPQSLPQGPGYPSVPGMGYGQPPQIGQPQAAPPQATPPQGRAPARRRR